MSLFTQVECERSKAFTYLGDDWLLLVDRCSKASQFLRRKKQYDQNTLRTLSEKGLQNKKPKKGATEKMSKIADVSKTELQSVQDAG